MAEEIINYDEFDVACVNLCKSLNDLEGIVTSESCSGHGKRPYSIYFYMDTTKSGARILSRCLSGRYNCYEEGELRADPVWHVRLSDTERDAIFLLQGKTMPGFRCVCTSRKACR